MSGLHSGLLSTLLSNACSRIVDHNFVVLTVVIIGGAEGDRTPDLMTASHALSQLSYGPISRVGGQLTDRCRLA